ncbi:hypothetical protein ISG33_09295 [Glaciecola sp. MH2013]|uniref:hypothetical protein n=1 Tax=Glaciecola sp. MH2013 TaxID=2785524 RepID=UPI00189E13AB|nr:hypothetical protein [Glaciecola sp. MH2013]MBF7073587.1 hypothetical protein [Glaciecola sp. MH2013]
MKNYPTLFTTIVIALCVNLSVIEKSDAKNLVDVSAFPDWFVDSLARETAIDTSTEFKNTDLGFGGAVKGSLLLKGRSEGYWYYTIDIATNAPVECHIFASFDGPANAVSNVVDSTLPSIEKAYDKPLTKRRNFALDIGVSDEVAYVLFDTLYTLGKPGEAVSGILKTLTAQTGDNLLMCLHNEVGYRATFKAVFESFVAAAKPKQDSNVFFENAFKMSFNGIAMGYSREVHSLDQDGDVHTRQYNTMLFPSSSAAISKSDTFVEQFARIDGSLINLYEYSVEDGSLSHEYSVSVKGNDWHVEGERQGEAVGAVLEYDGWLLSTFGSYLATAELLNGEEKRAEYQMWLSSANPLAAMPTTLQKLEGNKNANVELQVGPINAKYLAKLDGTFSSMSFAQEGITLEMTTLYQVGNPVLETKD